MKFKVTMDKDDSSIKLWNYQDEIFINIDEIWQSKDNYCIFKLNETIPEESELYKYIKNKTNITPEKSITIELEMYRHIEQHEL